MPEVLLVDDERAVRKAVRFALEDRGFAVVEAADGREGLEKLCAKTATGEQFDAIILDIVMPVVSGWEVMRALHSNPLWKHIPVLVMSGFANGPRDYMLVAKMNGVLVEKKEDFVEVLSEVLRRVTVAQPT
jgi:CheY-like chemotaxis protein